MSDPLTEVERNALDESLLDSGCHGFQGDHPDLYAAVEKILATRVAATKADRDAAVEAAVLALADDWDDFEHDLTTCPKYDCGDCTMKNAVYDLRTCVESVTGRAAVRAAAQPETGRTHEPRWPSAEGRCSKLGCDGTCQPETEEAGS